MSQLSDYSAPQYGQYNAPQQSASSFESQQNQVDLIKQQQDTLKNLQEQRKQLEALNSSYKSTQQGTETSLLDFSSSSPASSFSFSGNSKSQVIASGSPVSLSKSSTNQYDVLNRLSSFMTNVESKLELLGNSMRQLDLDIQLSANKQDRHIEQMSSCVKALEAKIITLKQQPQNPVASNSHSFTRQIEPQQFPQQAQNTNNSSNTASTDTPMCPVCSQSFSANEIHAHIESHFGEGSQVRTQTSQNEQPQQENSGFWSKLFKKKDDPPQPQPQPQQQQQQLRQDITPPTYNFSSGAPNNSAPTAIPAFYSPTGTVQYQSQPPQVQPQMYAPQGYPMAPRN